MSISKKDIEKLAELSRIDVSEEEAEKLQKDLERILAYAGELSRADTGGVEPLSHVTGAHTVARVDADLRPVECDPATLIASSLHNANGYVTVPNIWKRT